MPSSEDSRQPNDNHQTLRLRSSTDDSQQLDQTLDSQLYATIKNGTADVAHLRVLIPGFEILEELGRGAFGVVYRARDVKLDRHVAIKVSLLDDPNRREQYIREARNAAKLETIGIVPVFQVGTLRDGQPFVVQRLIDGNTLRKMMADAGAIDLRRACKLMTEIAEAVAHAHAVGMIHRDLKPDNILVDPTGRPWVADFGLAILEEDQKQHRGERAGTPLYMSPEQLRGRTEWLDGRTDIYALGIMLYEMLTGRPPFDAANLAELEEQVLHRDPKPITQRAPQIPAAMDVIFQNCCAKQVNDRYANAHELVADLQAILAELTHTDTELPPPNRALSHGDSSQHPFAPLPIPIRRKTLRQSQPLHNTLLHQSTVGSLRRFALPATIACVTLAGVAAILFWLPRRDANEHPGDGSESLVKNTQAIDEKPILEVESPIPEISPPVDTIPQRPFRVSKGSDGTHTSIRAAIAMAEEGETITILPGNYVETLALDRNLNLIGQGNRDDIVIVGEHETAVSLRGNIAVTLTNLTLDGIRSNDTNLNTIDVHAGALTLQDCNVYSRSYDCVKLRPASGLNANNCRFRTSEHPAIYADLAHQFLLTNCTFDIHPPTLDTTSIPVGVQAINCPGTIRGCTFLGSGRAVGIHWEATQQPLSIEDATVENCKFGIIVQDCTQVNIASAARTNVMGCENGLLLERSTATISSIDIHGSSGEKGIRIIDSREVGDTPRVTINDCRISGYSESMSIERANVQVNRLQSSDSRKSGIQLGAQAKLSLSKSTISDSGSTGIMIEDAQAILTHCHLINNAYAGILVDSYVDALSTLDCTFKDNLSGLLVASGTAKLEGGEFNSNQVGIVVMSHELLKIGDAGEAIPIVVDIDRVAFTENQNGGISVYAPCRYRINTDPSSQGGDQATPKIIGDLKAAPDGDGFVVKPSAGGGKKL